jgi:hypothetical protein
LHEAGEGFTMMAMRVKATVVGNTLADRGEFIPADVVLAELRGLRSKVCDVG